MAEHLVLKGKQWEADRLAYMEQERLREAENKIREIELLNTDQEQLASERFGKHNNNRSKARRSNGGNDMAFFMENERALMQQRMKASDKQFKPFTKDLRIVDAKYTFRKSISIVIFVCGKLPWNCWNICILIHLCRRRMSEASITSLKSIVAKMAISNLAKSALQLHSPQHSKSNDDTSTDDMLEEKSTDNSLCLQPIYVNPMIKRLKQTQVIVILF